MSATAPDKTKGVKAESPWNRFQGALWQKEINVRAFIQLNYTPDPHVVESFTTYRKTHNEGVFDVCTAEIRRCRSSAGSRCMAWIGWSR